MSRPRRLSTSEAQVYRLERRALLATCERVNTPRSLAVWIIAKAEDWDSYLSLPPANVDSVDFSHDYLVTAMLSKNPLLATSVDRKVVALEKWFQAEAQCKSTNDWVDAISDGRATALPAVSRLLTRVRDEVARVLGPLTRASLDFVEERMRFGPGATSSVSGRDVLPSRKFVASYDVTPKLQPYVRTLIPRMGGEYSSVTVNTVAYNKVTFVPKSAKTDRAIAIEPHANIFVQLGIGALLRQRLQRVGLDLNHQAEENRACVRRAQRDSLATIDLSSASDTVAASLVRALIPLDWCHLLEVARSEYSEVEGQEIRLAKFSSMGNGYTFELETLLFYCICRAVGVGQPQVFGDDIIVPQGQARDVVDALVCLGFSVNKDKTFLEGRFFESCGVDVFDGQDVRPFFLKGKYETFDFAVVRIANAIRVYCHRRMAGYGCDGRYRVVWKRVIDASKLAQTTASSLSQPNGLALNWDEARPSVKPAGNGWEGHLGVILHSEPVISRRTDPFGAYIRGVTSSGRPLDGPLQGPWVSDAPTASVEYTRGGVRTQQRTKHALVRDWYNFGPWI